MSRRVAAEARRSVNLRLLLDDDHLRRLRRVVLHLPLGRAVNDWLLRVLHLRLLELRRIADDRLCVCRKKNGEGMVQKLADEKIIIF